MADDSHLPIAVRRTRRSSAGPLRDRADVRDSTKSCIPSPAASLTSTPKKSKKRVRFSDPGPILANLDDEDLSTGLTPIIRRASLSSRKKRRHSTPLRHSTTPSSASGIGIPCHDGQGSPFSGEVHFLPLRQVLDGRVKRRIRRNGLSEEMNVITAEKKRLDQETKAEIERLKAELAEKDDEIHRLHDETVMIDSERVWELEQQVAALKRELANRSGVQQQQIGIPLSPAFEWTAVARDPFSDDFMDLDAPSEADTEAFGEETMAELLCSTPTRRARDSFPTPPTTSPPRMLATPCTRSSPSRKHVSVQAALPDPEMQRLELELASLKLEISKLTTTLESYSSLTTWTADKLGPYSPHPDEEPHPDVESRLRAVLQLLSDRTAALSELGSSLAGLGFPGSDASEVITSISSAFRTARLELEYLTPGEVTLPLTAAGAAVLDLLLTRLRELGKKSKEAEETIDEYHSIELSLRQQLGARVNAMDELKKDISTLQAENSKKDSQVIELEVGLERLKGAVGRYTRDVAELETLVQNMEQELATCNTSREKQKRTIQRQDEQLAAMSEQLEHKLSSAAGQTASLQSELAAVQDAHQAALSNHTSEISKLNKSHGSALALRDARVAELRLEIDRVNSSLRSAHEMIRLLRVENSRLAGENGNLAEKVEMERVKAKEVIDCMRDELKRVVRLGESFLVDDDEPATASAGAGKTVATAGTPSGLLSSGELAKKRGSSVSLSASRMRRRYDSGLGFLDEEEVDVEV